MFLIFVRIGDFKINIGEVELIFYLSQIQFIDEEKSI